MILAGSRHTLIANVVQQACAAALVLTLPNILSNAAYAETVFVIVLLSLVGLADLGLSLVYARAVPPLVARGDNEAVQRWDATVIGFGTVCAVIFSLFVGAAYLVRYGETARALLLLPIPLLTFWGGFHVTRVNARSDFSEYRLFMTARSLGALTAIPLAWFMGATGWFIGQLISAASVVARVGRGFCTPWGRLDGAILRRSLHEGVLLSLASVAWLQLINFARLYASAHYPDDVLATYGVATAAYQSLAALVISVFLPVSVEILRRIGTSRIEGFAYVTILLRRIGLSGLVGALVAAEAAPWLLHLLFPAYVFDARSVFALVLGVAFYPFIICWGNCLVGLQRAGAYLGLIGSALGLGWAIGAGIDLLARPAGAAIGQVVVLTVFPAILLGAVFVLAKPADRSALVGGAKIYALTFTLAVIYWLVRWT